jgi:hypothetical protein
MTRFHTVAAAAGLLVACEEGTGPAGAGGLALAVTFESSDAVALDSGRVFVTGPTSRTIRAVPGSQVTIDGLAPGSYTVTLEGFVGNEVNHFGHRAGIPIVAGDTTSTTISFSPFVTTLNPLPMYTTDLEFVVSFATIAGADRYLVEWDTSGDFVTPRDTSIAVTSVRLVVEALGRFHVRVRGVSASGALGAFSDPVFIETLREVDFDRAPDGSPIAPGTVVNSVYAPFQVEFQKYGPGFACGAGPEVFANSNQPAAAPTFQGNTVTTCPQGAASDISEIGFGVIEVRFGQPASQVCIDVAPDGPGHAAFIEAFDLAGGSLQRVGSPLGATLLFCITQQGTRSVRFSGDGTLFARFDNLVAVF